jgi:2',3'-cyclic-nucleotide 2'-phosphodiesterase (5'-nucleotidase family)
VSLTVFGYSDLEGVYDDPERVARLAGFLRERRDDATLVVGAGDDTALGVAATVSTHGDVDLPIPGGRAIAAPFFEAVRPDAETFGNHDLDHGPDDARGLVETVPARWTCVNLHDDGGLFGRDEGVERTRVVETAAGRVGLFGVTTERLPHIAPMASELTVDDPVATARETAADLRDRVDYVVGLSHCGGRDPAVAATADADLVLGGHRHEQHAGTYDGTLLVRTGGSGVVETVLPDATYAFHDGTDADPVPDLRAVYETVRDALGLDEVVAELDAPVPRDRATLTGGECRIGNFAADAFRAATGADVGVMHAGSLREGPSLEGAVTAGDVVSVSPFGTDLVTLRLPGRALHDALAAAADREDGRWFLHVSGCDLVWDHATATFHDLRIGGEPFDLDREYTLAIPEYFVVYDGLPTLTEARVVSHHGLEYDRLVDHARNGGFAVGVEGRITRVNQVD